MKGLNDKMSVREDYTNLTKLVEDMDKQLFILEELATQNIVNYGLNPNLKKILATYPNKEDIEDMDEDELKLLLTRGDTKDAESNIYAMNRRYEKYIEDHNAKNLPGAVPESFESMLMGVILDCWTHVHDLESLRKERNDIYEQMQGFAQNYFDYVNSKEYQDKRKAKIAELEKQLEEEKDSTRKYDIKFMLESMKKAEDLSFLTDHIDAKGKKEVMNEVDVFFNKERSSLVMKKFKTRIEKMGYSDKIYQIYFNIEEDFLPKEYHIFNNFFLFHIMRIISFFNVDAKRDNLYAGAILVKLYNLKYHKFVDKEDENKFIEFIKSYLDRFADYREKFEADNTTAPNHPARIQQEKEYEQKRRMMIISNLQSHGIEPDTSLETEELKSMLDDVLEKEANNEVEQEIPEAPINASAVKQIHPVDENEVIEAKLYSEDMEHPEEDDSSEEPVNTPSENFNDFIDKIQDNEDVKEFDKFAESIHNEIDLSQAKVVKDNNIPKSSDFVVDTVNDTYREKGSVINADKLQVKEITSETHIRKLPVREQVNISDIMVSTSENPVDEKTEATNNNTLDDSEIDVELLPDEPVSQSEVYVDQFGYYYKKTPIGTYNYYTREGDLYEKDIAEDTVLRLMSSGNLTKEIR